MLAVPKYIRASVGVDEERTCRQLAEEWAEEDGLTTLLPENGGDWWDVRLRNDPPIWTVEDLIWRWSIFECPVCFFVTFVYRLGDLIHPRPGIEVSVFTRGLISRGNRGAHLGNDGDP